ncbi:M28 family peptidase [Pedobacter sp. P351]|uniref:M28 family metallopeptidase n=1 Tax=Pedobacter superstes TaxID=3133441 RepID=UPI0030B44954
MRAFFILILTSALKLSFAQDTIFARKMVDTLASPHFWGRGYTKDGLLKASEFISSKFQSYGLKPLDDKSFLEEFSFPVNTFPGNMKVSVNGVPLIPGKDFIIGPESRGIKASSNLIQKDSTHFLNEKSRIMVSLERKLTWSVAQKQADYTSVLIDKKAIRTIPKKIKLNIENKFVSNYRSYNVCGLVKGTVHPDSLIVITAHFDHLGGMGRDTYFPGANDNASGVALLLDLAKYYAANPQKYSMVFIGFSGEEAGLVGSKFFTEHPLVDLKKIRFLINTDLAGTGQEGITVVNATEYKKEFALLNQLNDKGKYLVKINPRGKAANSDHYWFTEIGVPSFFIYTMGGIRAYHDIYDRAETLPLTEHEDLFRLIVQFNKALME